MEVDFWKKRIEKSGEKELLEYRYYRLKKQPIDF